MEWTYIYVSCGEGREINVFSLDSQSGKVNLRQRLMTSGSPVPMRVRAAAGRLYVGMRMENALQAFSIDPKSGMLESLGGVAAPGSPVYVSCDEKMRVAFSASYGDNNLSVFPLNEDGIPQLATQIEPDMPRAHAACQDKSGRWLLVPMLGADAIRVFRITASGHLEVGAESQLMVRSGSGPRHPVISADNRFVYVLNELDGSIDVFLFDADTGKLDLCQTIEMMPKAFDGKPWTAELRMTPDGRFLFATDRRSNTIASLRVDPESGFLSLVGHTQTEDQPRGMDVDPSGRWLVVSGQQSGAISIYAIDADNGSLALCHRHRTGKEPICVEIAGL